MIAHERAAVHHDRYFLIGIELVVARKLDRHAARDGIGRKRFDRVRRIERAVLERHFVLRVRQVDVLDVVAREAALGEILHQLRRRRAAERVGGDRQAAQIFDRLDLAALPEVGAHDHLIEAVARRIAAEIGHDAQVGAACDGVVQARRGRTAADVELAGRERRDHRLARRERQELHVQTFFFEVAFLIGDPERRIGRAGQNPDADRRNVGCTSDRGGTGDDQPAEGSQECGSGDVHATNYQRASLLSSAHRCVLSKRVSTRREWAANMDGHLWLIAGRTLIGLVFLWSGYDKIAAYGPTAGMMRAHAVPFTPIALPAAIVLELVCGVCMVAGFWVPWNALALIAFVVVASILIPVKDLATSDPRARHQTQIQLAGNIQIVGGLLFIFGASI